MRVWQLKAHLVLIFGSSRRIYCRHCYEKHIGKFASGVLPAGANLMFVFSSSQRIYCVNSYQICSAFLYKWIRTPILGLRYSSCSRIEDWCRVARAIGLRTCLHSRMRWSRSQSCRQRVCCLHPFDAWRATRLAWMARR
jgi:hypothetical protein